MNSASDDPESRDVDFGRTAADYERHRPGFPASFFDRLQNLGWISRGQRNLDIGTGTGTVALGLAARGLDVTGLDISNELLDVARRTAASRGLTVGFDEGRAEDTGQLGASFDVVSAGQCWWWFDVPAVTAEVKRVLAPGGRLLICDFSYLPLPGNAAARTEDLILQHNPGWGMAGWLGIHPEQVAALDRGGFQRVESFSYVEDVTFTPDGWRGRMRTCNGVGSSLSAEQVDAFDADLAAMLADEFPGELTVPHRVFAASGVIG